MKNLSKKIISTIIVLVIILLGTTSVKAEAVTAVSMSAARGTRLKAGETVTVNVSLAGGYMGFNGKLEYDNIFETVTMSGSGDWTCSYSSNTPVVYRASKTSSTEQVATITLKVKEGITLPAEATVKITGIEVSEDGNPVSANSAIVKLYADKDAQSGSEAGSGSGSSSSNKPASESKKITKAKASTKHLKAGDTTTIVIATATAILAIVAIMGFVKYVKNRDIK